MVVRRMTRRSRDEVPPMDLAPELRGCALNDAPRRHCQFMILDDGVVRMQNRRQCSTERVKVGAAECDDGDEGMGCSDAKDKVKLVQWAGTVKPGGGILSLCRMVWNPETGRAMDLGKGQQQRSMLENHSHILVVGSHRSKEVEANGWRCDVYNTCHHRYNTKNHGGGFAIQRVTSIKYQAKLVRQGPPESSESLTAADEKVPIKKQSPRHATPINAQRACVATKRFYGAEPCSLRL
ncbi:uncharacterized protein MEPE_05205 [Melanopsichium pennsylvanicum]|uniref:Uncharacterized protein n=1 Tax=Melanopsichium pennsylvanicum TaxID=63383 RepID=A0AAJ4XRB3_9BASI|nr:uncharacterized protein MEPE_05205 [Melanopsichium pennsylvanicum]